MLREDFQDDRQELLQERHECLHYRKGLRGFALRAPRGVQQKLLAVLVKLQAVVLEVLSSAGRYMLPVRERQYSHIISFDVCLLQRVGCEGQNLRKYTPTPSETHPETYRTPIKGGSPTFS